MSFYKASFGLIITTLVFFWFSGNYGSNIVYILSNRFFGKPENCQYFCTTVKLIPALQKLGLDVRVASFGVRDLHLADFIISFDFPSNRKEEQLLEKIGKSKLFAIILEPPLTFMAAYDRSKHRFFQHVFTWYDPFIDQKQYKKFFLPNPFHLPERNLPTFKQRKFCTLINSNKKFNHPDELYTWRIKAINFFNLEFYGFGWNKHEFPTYMGVVDSKSKILSQYKFCICFENVKNMPGYISEKIRDCFETGNIPIYWGDSNIEHLIPADCFIDMRKFKNFEELSHYLENFDESQYCRMLENIKRFIGSPAADFFSYDFFTYSILKNIVPHSLGKIFDYKTLARLHKLDSISIRN